jgi:short-subunit dehydrogenase
MKSVLITGTSTGIGFETALAFARNSGFHVIATMRNLDKKNALQHIIDTENLDIEIKQLDVTSEASVQTVVDQILQSGRKIDILINNAGAGLRATLEQTSLKQAQEIMDVNYYSVFNMTRAVLPGMRQNKSGHIISITSIGGVIGQPFNDAYCAAKFAVEGLMESLAPTIQDAGIHVSLVEPGPVTSEFVSSVLIHSPVISANLENQYKDKLEAYTRSSTLSFANYGQAAHTVARLLLEIAIAETPRFRYQTSDFSKSVVELKLKDTADQVLKFQANRLGRCNQQQANTKMINTPGTTIFSIDKSIPPGDAPDDIIFQQLKV